MRWVQLRGSGLWVSDGELNALGDYLPEPTVSDTQTREQLVPVLKRMRQTIAESCAKAIGQSSGSFTSAASSVARGALGEVHALDAATAGAGTNRYLGLVARNACHFAPFSWERWALFHNEAREAAIAHHAAGQELISIANIDTSVPVPGQPGGPPVAHRGAVDGVTSVACSRVPAKEVAPTMGGVQACLTQLGGRGRYL